MPCGGQNLPPKDVCVPIPGVCDYVTLDSKGRIKAAISTGHTEKFGRADIGKNIYFLLAFVRSTRISVATALRASSIQPVKFILQ